MLSAMTFFAASAGAEPVDERVLTLAEGESRDEAAPFIDYLLEDGDRLGIQEVLDSNITARFAPVERVEAGFGYQDGGVWLRLPVRNSTGKPLERVLHLGTNFMTELEVWQEGAAELELILSQDERSPFDSRPIPYHQLAVSTELPPRETTTFWIRYTSQGATVMPVAVETPAQFTQSISAKLTKDFAFYGIMAMFIIASIGAIIVSPGRLFVSYGLYVLTVLLYLFQRDGYAFQYLWPDAPLWNGFSSLPLGALLAVSAAFFAITYLGVHGLSRRMRTVLIAVMVFQGALVAAALFVDVSRLKQFAVTSTTICILIFLASGILAWRREGPRLLFFVVGWFGIVIASVTMLAYHNLGGELTRAANLDTMRMAIVFDALMMGLAAIAGLLQAQRERAGLLRQRETALREQMKLHDRLASLERRYELAASLAQSSSRRIADTAHDLRQPLYALRAAIKHVTSGTADQQKEIAEIEESFRYIETLVASALETATVDAAENVLDKDLATPNEAGKILSALRSMFRAESVAAEIDFRVVDSSAAFAADAVATLRILSNFIANCIAYAPGKRIVVGVRRDKDKLRFEVHDTGPGIAEYELEQIMGRCVQGEAGKQSAGGTGLGLAIVSEIAMSASLEWNIRSALGRGTVASLSVLSIS
ncbi:sensor histidine kinase [Pacificimonas sp. WHA3]|uniref:histidine kinase n=1 Tax=Pacificimonas pallii TaxID=2827236 RepID=A0ABS6SEM8_9SPHN|nr:sensor histidine kinase [Pacificimonas pallii]MBV7256854.1 sensor histidine kinase [Pacificimonas pallii]